MKRLIANFCLFLAATAVAGCAFAPTQGASPPQEAQAKIQDLRDKIAASMREVTLARRAATQLLNANKITLEQDRRFQRDLDGIRALLTKAEGKVLSNPADATALLAEALTQLANADVARSN